MEDSMKNQATYEIKEHDFAIFELLCKMFIVKPVSGYFCSLIIPG